MKTFAAATLSILIGSSAFSKSEEPKKGEAGYCSLPAARFIRTPEGHQPIFCSIDAPERSLVNCETPEKEMKFDSSNTFEEFLSQFKDKDDEPDIRKRLKVHIDLEEVSGLSMYPNPVFATDENTPYLLAIGDKTDSTDYRGRSGDSNIQLGLTSINHSDPNGDNELLLEPISSDRKNKKIAKYDWETITVDPNKSPWILDMGDNDIVRKEVYAYQLKPRFSSTTSKFEVCNKVAVQHTDTRDVEAAVAVKKDDGQNAILLFEKIVKQKAGEKDQARVSIFPIDNRVDCGSADQDAAVLAQEFATVQLPTDGKNALRITDATLAPNNVIYLLARQEDKSNVVRGHIFRVADWKSQSGKNIIPERVNEAPLECGMNLEAITFAGYVGDPSEGKIRLLLANEGEKGIPKDIKNRVYEFIDDL